MRYCPDCSAPLARYRQYCEPCSRKRRQLSSAAYKASRPQWKRDEVPTWTSEAAELFHAGQTRGEIALRFGVSISTVSAYARALGWDQRRHRAARHDRDYPWRDHARPLFEAGMGAVQLAALVGLGETSLMGLARRWGWDFDARHRALHTRDDGLTAKEADRARRMIRKYAGRSRREDRPTRAAVARLLRSTPVCPYCGRATPEGERTIDHIEPLTSGGSVDVDNLAAVCLSCNSSKQDTPLLVWLARRAA